MALTVVSPDSEYFSFENYKYTPTFTDCCFQVSIIIFSLDLNYKSKQGKLGLTLRNVIFMQNITIICKFKYICFKYQDYINEQLQY